MKCKLCGANNPDSATTCSVCMKPLAVENQAPKEEFRRIPEFHSRTSRMIPDSKTSLPIAAGGILIISAITILTGLMIVNFYVGEYLPEVEYELLAVNIVYGTMGVFVLAAGALAMMRRNWGIAIIATIVSFFNVLIFGWLCGAVQAMLCIAALAMLIQSRDEFKSKKHQH